MNNRVYNTDKVKDKIGLNEKKYDKIDVYVDHLNRDNVWATVYYTEYNKNKPVLKQEIVSFLNFAEAIKFVRSNFNGYELNHQVDYSKKQIFFHNVDYLSIDYYLHEGKPKLNYLKLNYKEYTNGSYHIKEMKLPKEYEDILLKIIKTNKNMNLNSMSNSDIIRTIDVYAKKKHNHDHDHDYDSSLGELIRSNSKKKPKQTTPSSRSNHIKNLKIIVSTLALGTLLTSGGYIIVKKSSTPKLEIINRENATINLRDIKIGFNQNRAEKIIDNMMDDNYKELTNDDIVFIKEYIKEIENSNFDYNDSTNTYNYIDYFSYKILENNPDNLDVNSVKDVLKKIEALYTKCLVKMDNELFINSSGANKYIDYVASLTFMYDTNVDLRGSGLVPMNNQSITSKYATQSEINTYNNYPLILKYIILNQLRNVISRSNYQVTQRPSNYFKGLDKESLIDETTKRMERVLLEIKNAINYQKKSL